MSDAIVVLCPRCAANNRVQTEKRHANPTCGRCKALLEVSGAPLHLDDDALDRYVANARVPVLVDFYADWCGPCRMIAPSLEQLGREHLGKLAIVKVDTEKYQRSAGRLGVQGIPALFLFDGGKVVAQQAGALSLPQLRSWLAPHLDASARRAA